MANNLKKIKGLTYSRDLADRVGVAMFMYARDLDISGDSTPEKQLAQWTLANAMQPDQTMLALVATDPDVISATTVVETDTSVLNKTKNTGTGINQGYTPTEVSLDEVPDEVITKAVADNWSRVAQKFSVPVSVPESVTVTSGDVGYNNFLEKPDAIPTSDVAYPTSK